MSNPILQMLNQPQNQQTPAQMPSANNPFQMLQRFQQFRQQMSGKNPQQMVENLLQSGQMSQQQFDQLKIAASGLKSMLGM